MSRKGKLISVFFPAILMPNVAYDNSKTRYAQMFRNLIFCSKMFDFLISLYPCEKCGGDQDWPATVFKFAGHRETGKGLGVFCHLEAWTPGLNWS